MVNKFRTLEELESVLDGVAKSNAVLAGINMSTVISYTDKNGLNPDEFVTKDLGESRTLHQDPDFDPKTRITQIQQAQIASQLDKTQAIIDVNNAASVNNVAGGMDVGDAQKVAQAALGNVKGNPQDELAVYNEINAKLDKYVDRSKLDNNAGLPVNLDKSKEPELA